MLEAKRLERKGGRIYKAGVKQSPEALKKEHRMEGCGERSHARENGLRYKAS